MFKASQPAAIKRRITGAEKEPLLLQPSPSLVWSRRSYLGLQPASGGAVLAPG
jgi:hypothetical protein